MKKVLLLLIPFLLSQCTDDDRKDMKHQMKIATKDVQSEAREVIKKINASVKDAVPAEILKLMRQHKNDKFPIQKFDVSVHEDRLKQNSMLLTAVLLLNKVLHQISTREDYEKFIDWVKNEKDVAIFVEIREKLAEILEAHIDDPFPLKPIPTKEIETEIFNDKLALITKMKFNSIINGASQQFYDEMLETLEMADVSTNANVTNVGDKK